MTSEYWDRFWRNRASRRRFLGAGAAFGAGTAGLALVGCGDDDDDAATPTATPQPGETPTNGETPDPGETRHGGTARYPMVGLSSGDPPTLFPYENLTYLAQHPSTLHYSLLLTDVAGADISPDDFTQLEGDIAEGLPEQPDDMTFVFRMRPNVHFHDKAPMNGRQATAQDFAETYEAFLNLPSQNAPTFEAVVDRVEATDDLTIRITLNEPYAPFLTTHASTPEGVWFIPVETIDSGQVQTDPVGTGPYVFDSYQTGVAINWNRNNNWYIDDIPYFDRLEVSMIADPQRILAGLRAGDFDHSWLNPAVYDEAQAQLDPNGHHQFHGNGVYAGFYFNFDNDGGQWRDKRLRQALSMSLDRNGALAVLDQTGQGDWFSPVIASNMAPYFLSPLNEGDRYGDNIQFFEHNPAEARQLMEAVTGSAAPRVRITANIDRYGRVAEQTWELYASQMRDVGWDVELQYQEYGAYIVSTYLGDIPEGIGLGPLIGSPRDPNDIMARNIASTSARHNWGGTPIDEMDRIDEMIVRQRQIMDVEERVEYLHDMQAETAEYMLIVPYHATAGYAYANPYVQNFHWKNSYSVHRTTVVNSWFDEERRARG